MLRLLVPIYILYVALIHADPIKPSESVVIQPTPAVVADSSSASSAKTPRTAAAAAAAALSNVTTYIGGTQSCPPSHLFSPCECFVHGEGARVIRCSGDYNIDLNPIFQRLSIYLPKPDKHFHMLYVNNTNLTYLGNVFHDITFEYICKLIFYLYIIT